MRKWLVWLFLCAGPIHSVAQVPEIPAATTASEQQLENSTESNEDSETEDDSYLQQLAQFQRHPVNVNTAGEALLKELTVLNPMQVEHLLRYRELMGMFISVYELQAVPGWDIRTIQKLLPCITVSTPLNVRETLRKRLLGGEHSVLVRVSQVPERSKGYLLDSSVARNFYPGSPQKLLIRYKYNYKNLLQFGVGAEKDAGEAFFKGSQRSGFDFYSAHLFVRNLGLIRSLALGDFTVNMGQGLIQWQSLAFKKGPDILATKRQSAVLRPYNSFGEINFHRGAGITIGRKNWEATVFGSYKKVDGNVSSDSALTDGDFISSLQTSGLHRTASEIEGKGSQWQLAFGGNVSMQFNRIQIGINGIRFAFKRPLYKDAQPYNLFALSGKSFGNYSLHYSYTYKNLHFFGEAAASSRKKTALVNGLFISVSNNIDLSLFYRHLSAAYQSLYSNAFTENTFPTNERGFFMGITIRPVSQWQIDAYADLYRFPWLKYRVNAPTTGSDYLLQVTCRPARQIEIYSRYKRESKAINYDPDDLSLAPVIYQPKQQWRTQMSVKVNQQFTVRNRAEVVWFDKRGAAAEQGFLLFADILYKPMMKPFSANCRLLFFETSGYNSRMYAYENDVMYSFSIPVIYDKGFRYYLNIRYDLSEKLGVWVKWAQTKYRDKEVIGSGLDEIRGSVRSEIKLQAMYKL